LDDNLAPYPGGLEESLAKKFGRNRWNGVDGLWIRDNNDRDNNEDKRNGPVLPPLVALPTCKTLSNNERSRSGVGGMKRVDHNRQWVWDSAVNSKQLNHDDSMFLFSQRKLALTERDWLTMIEWCNRMSIIQPDTSSPLQSMDRQECSWGKSRL
jgi:hypothetical protein